jgi:hypothetical protein
MCDWELVAAMVSGAPEAVLNDRESILAWNKLKNDLSKAQIETDEYERLYDITCQVLDDSLDEVLEMRQTLLKVKEYIKTNTIETGVCCCGDYVKDHNGYEGHSPVDTSYYAAQLMTEEIDTVLKLNGKTDNDYSL